MADPPSYRNSPHPPPRPSTKPILNQWLTLSNKIAHQPLNAERGREDLLLKIGIHEGPCLAVTLNDRQDYFGQTVNIASRVQDLADAQAILVTGPVLRDTRASTILTSSGIAPVPRPAELRGIEHEVKIFALP